MNILITTISVVVDSSFLLLLLFVWILHSVLVLLCNLLDFFFWFCNHLDEEERSGCFTLIVFLMYC